MLDRAKFLVVSEITEVMGEKTPVVEGKVEKALERSFIAKAKTAPPPKPKLTPLARPAKVVSVAAVVTPAAPKVSSKVTTRKAARA
jgi:hypothetical protein